MNKTDLQKRFEEEHDREAVAEFPHGKIYLPAYGEWCERKVLNLMDKADAYDRLSTWHDDLPKNDGRYICVIGDGKYPIICAKKFENGRWLLGERGKIRWAYLPDGWEDK